MGRHLAGRCGTGIKDHISARNLTRSSDAVQYASSQFFRDQKITWQDDPAATFSCLVADDPCGFNHISLDKRRADLTPLGKKECVGHATTEDQRVDFLDEILQHPELCRHLGPANNGRHRPLRRCQRIVKRGQFLAKGTASRCRSIMRGRASTEAWARCVQEKASPT